jgi:hypothetical protein
MLSERVEALKHFEVLDYRRNFALSHNNGVETPRGAVARTGGPRVDTETKNTFDVILSAGTLVTVLVGGAWAYLRFKREGVHQPRIELDVGCAFFGPQQGKYVAAFSIYVHNKGHLEYRFDDIRLRVRGIRRGQELLPWQGHEPRVYLPELLFEDAKVIDKEYIFVRPGVRQRLSYVTLVPEELRFIVARVTFMYAARKAISTRCTKACSHAAAAANSCSTKSSSAAGTKKRGQLHDAERAFEVRPEVTAASDSQNVPDDS